MTEELKNILIKFSESGWDLIDTPAKEYLNGTGNKEKLIAAIKQADEECGHCGCEFDALYKKALSIL
ncbi:MAG: hypothetical protein KBA53_11395 [Thermoclostridium sp.]|nr:hypothetical protein [Thermoclostridium sp.]